MLIRYGDLITMYDSVVLNNNVAPAIASQSINPYTHVQI